MFTKMNLCLICLRTDKLLKLASNMLEEFHDELCEFSVATMSSSCYYCAECEHLLTKFYEFKEKCIKAIKLYQKWMSKKASTKQPINLLYTLLPPTDGASVANPIQTNNSTVQARDSQTDISVGQKLTKQTYTLDVKMKNESSNNCNINKFADVHKNENAINVLKSEQIGEINDDSTECLLFKNVEVLVGDEAYYDEDSTGSNVAKHETGDGKLETLELPSKKVTAKQKRKLTENLIHPEKSKKMTVKKKAYYAKLKENHKIYDSVFDIEYLDTPEKKLDEFRRRKTYECYVKAEHKCEICYQVFKNLKTLKYHTDKWHNESAGSIYCPICKIWSSKASNHKVTHGVVFKCKICTLITYHRESMHNHFEWHKGKKYRCEQCNITCKSKSTYRSHMGKVRVHRQGRNVCESCGRGFRSPVGLAIHKSSSSRCTVTKEASHAPTATEGVRCDECDVTLPSQEVYDSHILDVHEPKLHSGQPHSADSAGLPASRITRRRGIRTRKYVRRTPAKEIPCRVCSDACASWFELQLHFRKRHPSLDVDVLYADKRSHLCDVCGTGFSQVYTLRDHMNIHTGARPYACDLCPKLFRSSYLLREHRVRHFPSTETCTLCGKQFKTRGNLYSHMKTHTGEKSHECDICGKGFLLRANLKEHVRGVHYNIRRLKRGVGVGMGPRAKRKLVAETDECGDSGE